MERLRDLRAGLKMLVEDLVLYRPRPGSKPHPSPDPRLPGVSPAALLETLRRDGAISLPGFFPKEAVTRLKALLDQAYAGARPGLVVRRSKENLVEYLDNPLRLGPEAVEMGFDPFLLSLIEAYLETDAYLADVDVRRVLPVSMAEYETLSPKNARGHSPAHWHYDVRGRQVKILVYLTDVGPEDQNFAYCARTHRPHPGVRRSRLDYAKSRFAEGWPARYKARVVECLGPAGTVLVVDTNLVHRLRRKNSRTRDTITYYYTPGQQLRPLDYDPAALARVPPEWHRLLAGRR